MQPYAKRNKAEHRCRICGAQDERTLRGLTECEACVKKRHACETRRRAERKAAGLCTICGKSDELTRAGRSRCMECAAKANICTERHKARLIQEHKCINCGRQMPDGYWFTLCENCRAKARKRYEAKHREAGTDETV